MAETDMNLKNFLIIIGVVVLLGGGMYLLTDNFVAKKETTKSAQTTTSKEEKSNDYIYASQTFRMEDNTYYVLFLDMESSINEKVYEDIIVKYTTNPVYIVDLSKRVNQDIMGETVNTSPTSVDDLKVADQTLIKIEGGKSTLYIEGLSSITSELK